MKILNILETILLEIKSLFFNGLFTILPLAATIFFINFSYHFLANWLKPLRDLSILIPVNTPLSASLS